MRGHGVVGKKWSTAGGSVKSRCREGETPRYLAHRIRGLHTSWPRCRSCSVEGACRETKLAGPREDCDARLYLAAGKCRLVDRTSHIGRDWEFVFDLVMTKRGVQGCAGISTHISGAKAIVTYR